MKRLLVGALVLVRLGDGVRGDRFPDVRHQIRQEQLLLLGGDGRAGGRFLLGFGSDASLLLLGGLFEALGHHSVGQVLDEAPRQLAVRLVVVSRDHGRPLRPGLGFRVRAFRTSLLFAGARALQVKEKKNLRIKIPASFRSRRGRESAGHLGHLGRRRGRQPPPQVDAGNKRALASVLLTKGALFPCRDTRGSLVLKNNIQMNRSEARLPDRGAANSLWISARFESPRNSSQGHFFTPSNWYA